MYVRETVTITRKRFHLWKMAYAHFKEIRSNPEPSNEPIKGKKSKPAILLRNAC
jgi:hypothetical protein